MRRFVKPIPFLLSSILILCGVLRITLISSDSLSEQEYAAYNIAALESFSALIERIYTAADCSPLFSVLSFYWVKLNEPNIIFLRLLSSIFGLGTLVMAYMATRTFLSRVHAAGVLTLFYFSAYHWYYSVSFTYHSMFLFFICSNTYAFYSLCFASKTKITKWLYVISGIAGFYTSVFIIFHFIAQIGALYCIDRNKRFISPKEISMLLGFIFIFSGGMVYHCLHIFFLSTVKLQWVSPPHIYTLPNIFLRFFFGVWGIGTRANNLAYCIAYGVFLMLLCKGFLNAKFQKKTILVRIDNNAGLTVAAVLTFIQVIVPLIVSFFYPIIDDGKNSLIYLLYPIYTLLAAGILSFRTCHIRAFMFLSFIASNIHSLIY
ncbi:hypothetical protein KDK77_09165 [bacterium]|nr:hypothetical protein [bacterium]MCP5461789.1 hypothetical protein [bacterium]